MESVDKIHPPRRVSEEKDNSEHSDGVSPNREKHQISDKVSNPDPSESFDLPVQTEQRQSDTVALTTVSAELGKNKITNSKDEDLQLKWDGDDDDDDDNEEEEDDALLNKHDPINSNNISDCIINQENIAAITKGMDSDTYTNSSDGENMVLHWDEDDEEEIENDIISIIKPPTPELMAQYSLGENNIKETNDQNVQIQVDNSKNKNNIGSESYQIDVNKEVLENALLEDTDDNVAQADSINEPNDDETDDDVILIEDDDIEENKIESALELPESSKTKNVLDSKFETKSQSPKKSLHTPFKACIDHGLNKPDMMLEIPSQEVIEFLDDPDVSCSFNEAMTEDITIEVNNSAEIISKTKKEQENKSQIILIDVDDEVSIVNEEDCSEKADLNMKQGSVGLSTETICTDKSIEVTNIPKENKTEASNPVKNKISSDQDQYTYLSDCDDSGSDVSLNVDKILSEMVDTSIHIDKDVSENNITSEKSSNVMDVSINISENQVSTIEGCLDLHENRIEGYVSKTKTIVDEKSTEEISEGKILIKDISFTDLNLKFEFGSENNGNLETESFPVEAPHSKAISSFDSKNTFAATDVALGACESEKRTSMEVQESIIPEIIDTDDIKLPENDKVTNLQRQISVLSPQRINEDFAIQKVMDVDEIRPNNILKNDEKSANSNNDDLKTSEVTKDEEHFKKQSISAKNIEELTSDFEPQPSTSNAIIEEKPCEDKLVDAEDLKGEAARATDSLGLFVESKRVMDDDEEEEEGDVDGDEEDYDQDESTNQTITEQSGEDSNQPHSETEASKEIDIDDNDAISSEDKEQEDFQFTVTDVMTTVEDKIEEGETSDSNMNVDAVVESKNKIEVTTEVVCDEPAKGMDKDYETQENKDDTEKETQKKTVAGSQLNDKATGKLSDTSVNGGDDKITGSTTSPKSIEGPDDQKSEGTEKNSNKPVKTMELSDPKTVLSFVDLDESSEDDVQEVKKKDTAGAESKNVGNVGNFSFISPPKEQSPTSNVKPMETAKTAPSEKPSPNEVLEVYSLDSDEEDNNLPDKTKATPPEVEEKAPEPFIARGSNRCINLACKSTGRMKYSAATPAAVAFFDAFKKKKTVVCTACEQFVIDRSLLLIKGLRKKSAIMEMDIDKVSSELVEISDSESEEEKEPQEEERVTIGTDEAMFIEKQLASVINESWINLDMDSQLNDAEAVLSDQMKILEAKSDDIKNLFNECQGATDSLRNDLYSIFEPRRQELPALVLVDTPSNKYICTEDTLTPSQAAKRRLSSGGEIQAKRPAIPMGYAPLENEVKVAQTSVDKPVPETPAFDDDKDIAVLQVSAEVAPASLPPPGEIVKPPVKAGQSVFAIRNTRGSWLPAKVIEIVLNAGGSPIFTMCRVKFTLQKLKHFTKTLPARCLAYSEPATVRMTIGTRLIALFKDPGNTSKRELFYSGVVAEVPNPVNNYRYLVFFDDGYAKYVNHEDTRLVYECSPLVWEEVHPLSRQFVREYLVSYPERPMVRLHPGQHLKTEWNGKWWPSRVVQVDASLVQVHFEKDNRVEWIYRGSTRLAPLYLELQAAERHRARPRTKAQPKSGMPYVEYTREEQNKAGATSPQPQTSQRETRQRAVAKKSTAAPQTTPASVPENLTSRVVYYTPKNAVKPYKMVPHVCGPRCKRNDVLGLKDLRTYNPLAKPLLSGWERQIVRFKCNKEVLYRAPCGRRIRNVRELHRYLRAVQCEMPVDLFDFAPSTHCLAEYVLNTCIVGKKDLSHGKENVPIPCVNYFDESLPEFCSYNTERTPTAGVPLNLDPEFLCGCDCTDDCVDKSKCACWKMTLEGANTIGLKGPNVGYVYKRLPEPLPSGIYECNSRCRCKQTCLNRVAQHPLQLKLQVFKTTDRGWGIRALNDVPKGAFLCVYAGNLLTDATANMDGLNEGDEYLAELDYIEVVEQMKEGYEEDIPEADKKLDRKNQVVKSEEEEHISSEEEVVASQDDDFQPGYHSTNVSAFSKRLRKRNKKKEKEEKEKEEKERRDKEEASKTEDDCITISDDEEVREPSRFTAQAGMGSDQFVPKYRSVRSYFGKDEACYIMDAKVQGNIGRYLNHSCSPNVFVQNVFVDTHDPRFPWVAFFALCQIKAGTELTWNYNYDVGSVPEKVLYCYCGAPNCRGRLL